MPYSHNQGACASPDPGGPGRQVNEVGAPGGSSPLALGVLDRPIRSGVVLLVAEPPEQRLHAHHSVNYGRGGGESPTIGRAHQVARADGAHLRQASCLPPLLTRPIPPERPAVVASDKLFFWLFQYLADRILTLVADLPPDAACRTFPRRTASTCRP